MLLVPTRQLQQQNGSVSVLAVSVRQRMQFARRNLPNAMSLRSVSKPNGNDGVHHLPCGNLVLAKFCITPTLPVRAFLCFHRPIAVHSLSCGHILRCTPRFLLHPLQPRPVLRPYRLNCCLQLPRQPVPAAGLSNQLPALPRSGRASNGSNLVRFRQSDVID